MEPVKQPVTKTATEHAAVDKKQAERECGEKTAASIGEILGSEAAKSFVSSVAGGLGAVAAVGGATYAGNKINQMRSSADFKRALDKAVQVNPRLRHTPKPELEAYLGLIAEASPSVARNPLLLANYLEYLLDHQGQLNYTAYGDLVKLEGNIQSNRAGANPLTGSVQKAIVDNSIRGAFDTANRIDRQHITNAAHQQGFEAAMRRQNVGQQNLF